MLPVINGISRKLIMQFLLMSVWFLCMTQLYWGCSEAQGQVPEIIDPPPILVPLPVVINPNSLPAIEAATTADGSTWFAIRDFGSRQQGQYLGTGSFLTFQSKNAANVWGDWAYLNGGLIDRTPGQEQGDLDLIIYVDGAPAGIALQGRIGPAKPALIPIYDGELSLGRPEARFLDIALKGTIHLPGVECPNQDSGRRIKKLPGNGEMPASTSASVQTCIRLIVDGVPGWISILRK